MATTLTLHPDRALPADPTVRDLARTIYAQTASLPLVGMHGHVEAQALADDAPFGDPASLLVTPDHYVTRMLYSQGVAPHRLGVGGPPAAPRDIWRTFCEHWHLFRGTPSRYWLEHELVEVFGVTTVPSARTADTLYDQISAVLDDPAFRPRALLDRFNIELIATTDPATSPLEHHTKLAADGFGERVVPTFRPDAVTHPARSSWAADVAELGRVSGVDTGDYPGYLEALRRRRAAFVEAGALATDHGHLSADTTPLSADEAARIYRDALKGPTAGADAFSGHMLHVMAGMSAQDGLVMQLHPGVLRDHHSASAAAYGPDRGWDIPVGTEFTRSLRPLLEDFGMHPGLRLILFTVDETSYSRELAPLAGVYPSVRLGAPWWFLDSPHAMRRFREAATETAGFYNTSGFVDDTRAYASIPARHDLSRRVDAGYLATLVAEHRLSQEEAAQTAVDLAYHLPKLAYARRPA
ncbi:glucuronate isomerase [Kineosporia sp. NBRC 101731]|uniref:glucuronate isomerase n=1 Tax=Kineosporia sp. NBRC 101731 TaxID=3032199 RepID=UPI0024A0E198|nr:glucuronate isomerase [Kineosporia sp. NBRC 101731]GLY32594.1 uronate isomerase [Kineosporia sp. NBRC 101731]